MSWKKEFDERFPCLQELKKEGYYHNETKTVKDFIEALLKEAREDEHKKTWDNIKEIYDTTDYKKYIEEEIKETALKCKAIGQRTIRNTEDWRSFADAIEKEYNIKIGGYYERLEK
jgi:hypothetical protein